MVKERKKTGKFANPSPRRVRTQKIEEGRKGYFPLC
jgi:hypothetical protein